jgi:hypothetical protein
MSVIDLLVHLFAVLSILLVINFAWKFGWWKTQVGVGFFLTKLSLALVGLLVEASYVFHLYPGKVYYQFGVYAFVVASLIFQNYVIRSERRKGQRLMISSRSDAGEEDERRDAAKASRPAGGSDTI